VRRAFADLPDVLAYLDAVEADIVDHAAELLAVAQRTDANPPPRGPAAVSATVASASPDAGRDLLGSEAEPLAEEPPSGAAELAKAAPARPITATPGTATRLAGRVVAIGGEESVLRRYAVNVLVDRSGQQGAPYVTEDHPTLPDLVGRVEYLAHMGTLVTDFLLIRPGALHRANGGYLVLEAAKLLAQPFAWEHLKRALRSGAVHIESMGQSLGLMTTVALEPEPIPLRVKVALVGERLLYYLLCALDPEFPELFKVEADFEDEVERTPRSVAAYASLMATLVRREGLRPLDREGVARAIEHLSRMADDARKLSTRMGRLTDLLREADHVAELRSRRLIGAEELQAAIDARERRGGRLRERMVEAIARDRLRVRTEGLAVGQVNALSVVELGETSFGHPSRVSAAVRLGEGEVVDIEREVELGGPIHSKGVLILSGFLGARFGRLPLSAAASLVFEQTYGGVEGDSASLAELCALLSAIGGVPLRQSLAVTGSVDQKGDVQAVGGVNDKIEGFFDACAARGLTGEQGVLIPRANVDDLMLAWRVREAARDGRFRVWPVSSVDEALTLLTGMPAGRPDRHGDYPADSVNGRVAATLREMAETARRWAREKTPGPA
jgi:lon-related putative ATP-dependent protease